MNETIFVQFYSRIENTNPRFKGQSIYELCNGFSDTYDLCKSKGDFVWINHSKQLKGYGKNTDNHPDIDLPISKGTAYVSAYYLSQLYQVYMWAEKYPNINFIVGGPSTNPRNYIADDFSFPSNITIVNKTVEDYFEVENFSYPWNLELPNEDHDLTLTYSYTLRSSCYWGKCIFCNQSQGSRIRPKINFEFKNVEYSGKQRVNLYTPAMTANQLKILLYDLEYNENIRYDIYLRGNKSEREALKEILQNKTNSYPQIKFILGVEYPSNRMLTYMNKNVTVEGILETIKVLSEFGHHDVQIQLPFILGWDNLIPSDLADMSNFLDQLPYDKIKFSFSVNLLTAKPNTYVFDNYEIGEKLYYGPFYYGFMPKIDKGQMYMTKQAVNMLFDHDVTVFDYSNIRGM